MDGFLLEQYGAAGIVMLIMMFWGLRLQKRIDDSANRQSAHEGSYSERNERLAEVLGRIDERMKHGDSIMESLVESNNRLSQTVAVLADRGDRQQ